MSDPSPITAPGPAPWSMNALAALCAIAGLAPTVAAIAFLITSSTAGNASEFLVSGCFVAFLGLISLVFVMGAKAIRRTGMLLAPRLLGGMLIVFGGAGMATTVNTLAASGNGVLAVLVCGLVLIVAVALLVLPHLAGGTRWAAERRDYVAAKVAEAKRQQG